MQWMEIVYVLIYMMKASFRVRSFMQIPKAFDRFILRTRKDGTLIFEKDTILIVQNWTQFDNPKPPSQENV